MPLSEEEQRILHEMEQKLYEHDRAFVDRVRSEGPHSYASRSLRWSILALVAGFALLILSFRQNLVLGTAGFLVMLFSSFLVERSARQVRGTRPERTGDETTPGRRGRVLADEIGVIGTRLRSRLRRRH